METGGWQAIAGACAALVLLGGLVWSGPPAAPPLSTQPAAATEPPVQAIPDAAKVWGDCHATQPGTLVACVQARLEDVLAAHGDEVAFALLANVTELDTAVAREAHNVAHHMGRFSLAYYPNATEALRHCPPTMSSGCFHGVLERHFNDVGPPALATDVTGLCSGDAGRFRLFQCLHGLGHGLSMVALHDLPLALSWCDFFGNDSWAKESCGGGVFMENVIGDTTMQHDHANDVVHDSTWVRFKPEDPLYPCDQVEQRWWHSCYWLQSSVLLREGTGYAGAFAGCKTAPSPYDAVCYQSMGRDISGAALRDGPKTLADCQLGGEALLGHCIYGAVQEMINNAASPEPAVTFCPIVPAPQKSMCYRGLGGMLHDLQPDPQDRVATCMRIESDFRPDCLLTAGGSAPTA
jgi:hypothetical protein